MGRAKLTRHQKTVLELFEASEKPLSVRDIIDMATPPRPGQATVYRALARLQEMELIQPVEIHGATPMWESTNKRHHHHFFCTACHEVYSIDGCPDGLPDLVPQGFRMHHHSIILYGSCADCSTQTKPAESR